MRIAITGTDGLVGRNLVEELSIDHDVREIDVVREDASSGMVVDARARPDDRNVPAWIRALDGCDVLIHSAVAQAPSTESPIDVELRNIRMTWSVFEAAAGTGVSRVVLVSSRQVVRGHELELLAGTRHGHRIGADASFSPLSYHGVQKACCELAGRNLVEAGRLDTFIAVRLGNLESDEPLNADGEIFGITASDLRRLFRRSVEAEVTGVHVIYGVSGPDSRIFERSVRGAALDGKPRAVRN